MKGAVKLGITSVLAVEGTFGGDMEQSRKRLKALCRQLNASTSPVSTGRSMAVIVVLAAIFLRRLTRGGEGFSRSIGDKFLDAYQPELAILVRTLPGIQNRLPAVIALSPDELRRVEDWALQVDPPFDDLLAWAFQYLKHREEKSVYQASLKDGVKIAGESILPATQFFTERYMVRHLITRALDGIGAGGDSIERFRLLDPACGGGNFLQFALEVLFHRMRAESGRAAADVLQYLLEEVVVGYDLDPDLAEVACLGLYLKAVTLGPVRDGIRLAIYTSDTPDDEQGALRRPLPQSPPARRVCDGASVEYAGLLGAERYDVVITNPPFMGPRNMGRSLKEFLTTEFAQSRGDLCVAFFMRIMELLRPGGRAGIVTQSSWMYLKTFRAWRYEVLRQYQLVEIADLGSGAFQDISGEKTNVALISLRKLPPRDPARLITLRSSRRAEKAMVLSAATIPAEFLSELDQARLCEHPDASLYAQQPSKMLTALSSLPTYGDFAVPMQGTSTGNNELFVDYQWKYPNHSDWVLVSKGGGYCKWSGLNIFRVLWGQEAEYIRDYPGSAVRNLQYMAETALVFSDTGTLGLNVRLLKPGQVFIASGPGIRVRSGDALAHLAFLNSRVATYFLRLLNPKLTIAAGYIAKLPVVPELLYSSKLAAWASECVRLKERMLERKLGNVEYRAEAFSGFVSLDDAISSRILADFDEELQRLELEASIDQVVIAGYGLNKPDLQKLAETVGVPAASLTGKPPKLDTSVWDAAVSSLLNKGCHYVARNRRKFGTEGVLEELALEYFCSPKALREVFVERLPEMTRVRALYCEDLLHRVVLASLGYGATSAPTKPLSIFGLADRIRREVPMLGDFPVERFLEDRFMPLHKTVFRNRPIVDVSQREGQTMYYIPETYLPLARSLTLDYSGAPC